jgi:hypothetical protein
MDAHGLNKDTTLGTVTQAEQRCGIGHLRDLVIPAKAGIYSPTLCKCAVVRVDSRFRGNDRRLEWIPIPNDTSTHIAVYQLAADGGLRQNGMRPGYRNKGG